MSPPSGGGGGTVEAVDVKSVFIGAGCNRVVNNVSWGPSGLVSFGAQNGVALFHPQVYPLLSLTYMCFVHHAEHSSATVFSL